MGVSLQEFCCAIKNLKAQISAVEADAIGAYTAGAGLNLAANQFSANYPAIKAAVVDGQAITPASVTSSGPVSGTTGTFSGNVGIGTTTPTEKLEVAGNTSFIGDVFMGRLGGSGWSFQSPASDMRVVGSTSGAHFAILPSGGGNVGIGTTTPTQKLDVAGNIKASGSGKFGTGVNGLGGQLLGVNTPSGTTAGMALVQDGVASWAFRNLSLSTTLVWEESGVEYLRLTGAGNLIVPTVTSNLSSSTADGTSPVGFRNIPSNPQAAAYTTILADAGKSIDHLAADANIRTYTIAGAVAYPIGSCISFSNMTSQVITIAITTDVMYLAGAGTTGSRSLAQFGVATARKQASGVWIISGINLT